MGKKVRLPAWTPLTPRGHMAVARSCNFFHHPRLKLQNIKPLTFAASVFAKASFCTVLAVQALAKALVGPEAGLVIVAVLAVGGQDCLVQSCLGIVSSLKKYIF